MACKRPAPDPAPQSGAAFLVPEAAVACREFENLGTSVKRVDIIIATQAVGGKFADIEKALNKRPAMLKRAVSG